MRKIFITLAVWLALVVPASASTLNRNCVGSSTSGGSPWSTVTAPVNVNGDTIELCAADVASALGVITFPTGFTPLSGTGLPVVGTGVWMNCATKTASSEPANYTISWTGIATSGQATVCAKENTDGSTPVVDVAAGATLYNTDPIHVAQVTTNYANDALDFEVMANVKIDPGSGVLPATFSTFNGVGGAVTSVAGQQAAGPSIQPFYARDAGGTTTMDAVTVAWKSNTTTAGNFIGVGAESYTASGALVSPTVPSNGATGDTLIAAISELATSGVVITPVYYPGTYAATGVTYSATTLVNTDAHTSVTLDGTAGDVYATIPAPLIGTTDTCEVWFKFTGTTHGALCKLGDVNSGWGVGIGTGNWDTAGTTLLGEKSQQAWVTFASIPSLVAGTTYHVVAENGGSTFYVWLNGTRYTGSANGGITPATEIAIGDEYGASPATRFLAATLQKAAFYSSFLNTAQIANHYLAGTTAPSGYVGAGVTGGATYDAVIENDHPIVYWNLGDSSGPTAPNLATGSWTKFGSSIVQSGDTELDLYWAPYSPSLAAAFSFGSSIKASGVIVDFSNLNTVPIDAECSASSTGLTNSTFPACSPTARDELFYRFVTGMSSYSGGSCFPGGVAPIYYGLSSAVGAGYSPFTQSGLQTGCGGFTNPFSSVTLGLSSLPALAGGWFAP